MKRFVVLEKVENGNWCPSEPVEAITAELAIGMVAQAAGSYIVLQAAQWVERKVEPRTVLAVVND